MVFVADDLGAWLIGLLANAGRKKLSDWVLGTDQERALRSVATAAVQRTAEELHPGDDEQAEQESVTEALQAGIAAQLAVLDDPNLTGTGQSSADVLGVSGTVVAEKLTDHLLWAIRLYGARGGPLFPLASQLNHDLSRSDSEQLKGVVGEILEAVARPDAAHVSASLLLAA